MKDHFNPTPYEWVSVLTKTPINNLNDLIINIERRQPVKKKLITPEIRHLLSRCIRSFSDGPKTLVSLISKEYRDVKKTTVSVHNINLAKNEADNLPYKSFGYFYDYFILKYQERDFYNPLLLEDIQKHVLNSSLKDCIELK